jgi:hypothetical protein
MVKYKRVGQLMIRPLLLNKEHSPFDLARLFYAQYMDLDFADDLIDYHRNGFVVSRPTLFAMFKVTDYEGEPAWFVRIAIGNLLELLGCMPCQLPKLIFDRNNENNVRVVDTKRLLEVANRKAG